MYRKRKFDIDEVYHRFWAYKEKADKFLLSRKGIFMRFGVLGGLVIAYPIANIVLKGPLLSIIFSRRYNITEDLPERIKKAITQQTFVWLEKEGQGETDTFFSFSCQNDAHHNLDSIRMGTLSSPTGAQIALPFYAKFSNEQEAMEFAENHLQPFDVLGKTACIIWDSDIGRELISTFVLSDEALAFLIARDLYGVQKPYLLTHEALSWFCHVLTYMLCFYAVHMFAFNGDSLVFLVAFPILCIISIFTALEWNKLAIYSTEYNADVMAANLSTKHTQGAQEYYMKFLQRNRLLRELVNGGEKIFTPIGDIKKSIAHYVSRYGGVNDIKSENEELTISIAGDDLPE